MEISELARYLDRTERAIRMYAYRKGFRKQWTDAEVEFLKENYRKLSIDELVFELDRPEHAITQKVYRLKKERMNEC